MELIRDRLLGSWSMKSFEQQDQHGIINNFLGKDPKGMLNYLSNGRMSALMIKSGAEFSGTELCNNKPLGNIEPEQLTFKGTYEIDEDNSIAEHTLEICTRQKTIFIKIKLSFELTDDELHFVSQGPSGALYRFIWEQKTAK
jgi:hypothetical protein